MEGVIIPADRRLDKEEARRLNGKEQKENIAFQNRLLELEGQREKDEENAIRDSCVLYDDDEIIYGSEEEKKAVLKDVNNEVRFYGATDTGSR